jgi:NAD(P)-dependent dehydrogenase (short-subunit alcohol dehydrogenase family)
MAGMERLSGRAAFVTGAASGIGLAIARHLAKADVSVVLGDIRADLVESAAAEVRSLGGNAVPVVVDVSDRASVAAAADFAEREVGNIHILANNAGVAMHGVPVESIAASDWDWVIGVNVYGVIHGIQTFLPRMRGHGEGGHIVNTASIAGFQVNPAFLTGAYSMTKYAVVALSEALEQELAGSGIGVSVLCPAAVATSLHFSERNRPERLGGPTVRAGNHFLGELIGEGLPPDAIGARVVEAIAAGEFYIFTHAESRALLEKRHRRIEAAFDRLPRPRRHVA